MGLIDSLKKLFDRFKAIQSIQSSIQSDSIDSIASQIPKETPRKEAVLIGGKGFTETQQTFTSRPEPVLEKDSFQLGLAAGYTGRSIKEIEHSLTRIESQMPTKDWFKTEFEDKTPELAKILENIRDSLKEHDLSMQNKFEAIQSSLGKMQTAAINLPEPVRTDILKEIEVMRSQIPLSAKMIELVSVVKALGELSYENLATRLSITIPALRGLLSNTMKRTDEVERFKYDGKGWVRYKGFKKPLENNGSNDSID